MHARKHLLASAVLACLIALPAQQAQAGFLRDMFQGKSSSGKENAGDGADTDIGQGGLVLNMDCKTIAKRAARHYKRNASKQVPAYANVAYGAEPAQQLDVYTPAKSATLSPIIFMVHGGAWCVGDKSLSNIVDNKEERWVGKGFIFVSVNYRMLPDDADVAAQSDDVASALAYVQMHARNWGGDASRIIIMGHSAGAHLVSLLSSDAELAARHNVKPWLGTVSLDSAVMDVPRIMRGKHPSIYDQAFSADTSFWKRVSPIDHLSAYSRPWFGVCSSKRHDSCPQAHAYAARAQGLKVDASVVEENLSHEQINEKLGLTGDYTDAVEAFMGSLDPAIKEHLQ